MSAGKLSSAQKVALSLEAIAGFCGLLYALYFAVTVGAYPTAVLVGALAVVLILYLAKMRKANPKVRITAGLLIIAVTVATAMFPCSFKSSFSWRYIFQKEYAENRGNIGSTTFFPQSLPENATDFTTEFSPSLLGGSGHYSVAFCTDETTVSQYRNYAEQNAVFTCTLEEYLGSENGKYMSREQYDKLLELSGSSSASLSIWADDIAKSDSEKVDVYVLSSNFDWNSPQTSAILINENSGRVEFSRLG